MLTPLMGSEMEVSQRYHPPDLGENTADVFESMGMADRYEELSDAGAFSENQSEERLNPVCGPEIA